MSQRQTILKTESATPTAAGASSPGARPSVFLVKYACPDSESVVSSLASKISHFFTFFHLKQGGAYKTPDFIGDSAEGEISCEILPTDTSNQGLGENVTFLSPK